MLIAFLSTLIIGLLILHNIIEHLVMKGRMTAHAGNNLMNVVLPVDAVLIVVLAVVVINK